MNKLINACKAYIKKRNKQVLSAFELKVNEYLSMSDTEFTLRYIEVSARYERKKIVIYALSIIMLLSIIMDYWKDMILILSKVSITEPSTFFEGAAVVAVVLTIILFIVCLILISFFVHQYYQLSKEKLFIQEIKQMRIAELDIERNIENATVK